MNANVNMIDTPGHVDFAYEVSRSMRAVEGSLLVVDSTQGVEAQTLANVYQAIDADHEIVPVLNKIDLPAADCDRVAEQIEDVIGIDATDAIQVSAKTGIGIKETLEAIVKRLPAPKGERDAPLKAMLVDSWYDAYLGVIVLVRIMDGVLKKGDQIRMMQTNARYGVERIGVFRPAMQTVDELGPGESALSPPRSNRCAIPRWVIPSPMTKRVPRLHCRALNPRCWWCSVACSRWTVPNSRTCATRLRNLRSMMRLSLTRWKPPRHWALASAAASGVLHLEVIRDRIEREYNIELITTAPSVVYHVFGKDGVMSELHNPADMPDLSTVDHVEEPRIKATILVPDEYLGDVLKLCQDRRGIQEDLSYAGSRAMVVYDLPLNEVVFDFYDRLKSVTKGYASFDYQMIGYRIDNLVKMSVLVNDEPVDALSMMVHRDRAEARGRAMCEKLKELIPRHMFKIPIQAAIGGKVIARETLSAMRKDVTAKCYGGDATRKRKLDKQKAGKKKMLIWSCRYPARGVYLCSEDGRLILKASPSGRSFSLRCLLW